MRILVNINTLVETIVSLYREKIEDLNASIVFENLPTIESYETPVYQLLQNLISNSLKYHSVNEPPRVEISVVEQETDWLFTVKDNGIDGHVQCQCPREFVAPRKRSQFDQCCRSIM